MPIYEMSVKYPVHVLRNDANETKTITAHQQGIAISEFNTVLTSARESLKYWFWEPDALDTDYPFGGVLTIDTDDAPEILESPESQLMHLADRLDAFLVGRFYITARSPERWFGEVQERSRRSGEDPIVDASTDESPRNGLPVFNPGNYA
jgi:hypothetical protein